MERKSMGQFIAALRKANGLTQKQLADKLNLSDKTVSRWERDETAPDISLIPVIADIFGITCDELLCGERKPEQKNAEGEEEVLSARGEKQRRRIMAVGLSEFKNRSVISCGVAAVGMIAALICNFAFTRAYLGFFISIIFYLAAAVCQVIFVNKAFLSVADDGFSSEETVKFKSSVVRISKCAFVLIVFLCAVSLPLVLNPVSFSGYYEMDAYMGIWASTWLVYGALYGVAALIICLILCRFISSSLVKKGVISESDNEKRLSHNLFLLFFCAVSLAVVVFLTFGVYCAVTDDGYWPKFADGIIFEDYESFAEFMEQDVPSPDMSYYLDSANVSVEEYIEMDYEDDEYFHLDERSDENYDIYIKSYFDDVPYGIYDDSVRIVIKDMNGKTVADCIRMNDSVVNIEYGEAKNGFLPIKVVTYDEKDVGQQRLMYVNLAFIAVYAIEAGIALFVYLKKREKKN